MAAANFIVRYERDEDGWWVASIASVPGCVTQGKTIEQARERIREALAALTNDRVAKNAKLVDDVVLPAPAKKAVRQAVTARDELELLSQRMQAYVMAAARSLEREGLSLRDVGSLLGVSRQRAHQLLERKGPLGTSPRSTRKPSALAKARKSVHHG